MLHATERRWADAATDFDRSSRIVRRYVTRTLSALSDNEQLTFLSNQDSQEMPIALSVAFLRRSDAAIVERSATWLLNGKAVALEALSQRRKLRDFAVQNPEAKDFVDQLLQARGALAGLGMSAFGIEQGPKVRYEMGRLDSVESVCSAALANAGFAIASDDPWVELAAVRKALKANAIFIDIARFAVWEFPGMKQPPHRGPEHYVAWLVPADGQGQISIVDLGDADKIDIAVRAALREFQSHESTTEIELADATENRSAAPHGPTATQNTSRGLDLGSAHAAASTGAMRTLAKLVFNPLQSHLGKTDHLIISPDSDLWLVPWAALPLGDGKYAIEKYKISYVISGRELVRRREDRKILDKPNAPVLFANPDYDLSPDEVVARTNAVLREHNTYQAPVSLWNGLVSAIANVARLPGTAAEADAVEPKLKEYCHADPVAYTDQFALEGVFKHLHSPRVVVLSTHGFTMADQVASSSSGVHDGLSDERSGRAALTTAGKPTENPLLRCGLLLAGCNSRIAGQYSPSGDDGILTGEEIVDTDLLATELVVLSACDTGLGDVHNGEGVAGLRQAFQIASAKTVVATLWQIPDRETATLMSDFFAKLAAGETKTDALRDAQLILIQTRRKKLGSAPPYFWAAFTLTGE
jgi:CHAT domain-containing protein